MSDYVKSLMQELKAKNPAEPEFHQAVEEVVESLSIVMDKHPEYRSSKVLERIIEPERVIMFRIPWMDDQGTFQVNRGFILFTTTKIGLRGPTAGSDTRQSMDRTYGVITDIGQVLYGPLIDEKL